VSCRNVLIYFDQALQKRVLPTFHYALGQPGFLVLGRTENISGFDRLFEPTDKVNRIFARTAQASVLRFAPRSAAPSKGIKSLDHGQVEPVRRALDLTRHLDRLLLARYSPPGVLINEKLEVLQYFGQTGSYLQPPPGEPQNHLVKMARGGLLGPLRAALTRAKQHMAPSREDGVEVDAAICNIVVIPFTRHPDVNGQLYVVLFEDASPPSAKKRKGAKSSRSKAPNARALLNANDKRRLPKVEHELSATKEYLQSLIEDHVRTTDELGSANEELVSGNEELQSMNEELETAKEELQSTNEELTTVNDELQSLNQEATQTNSDLVNLLATVDIPLLILDTARKIRRFTPRARSILNVLPADIGRPFDDIKTNINVPDLDRQIADVVETLVVRESEVQDREGRWYRLQIRPYKTTDNRIDGAILSLVDIHAMRLAVGEADQARGDAEQANRAKDQFLAVLSHELRTPLTSILLHAQLLHTREMDGGKIKRAGESIERSAKIQLQLIEDLLDVSRIVAGKFHIEFKPVDLHAAVLAAVDDVAGSAKRKSLELKVHRHGASHGLGRRGSPTASRVQPPRERHQIHAGEGSRDGRARDRRRKRATHRQRYGNWDRPEFSAECLQSIRSRRYLANSSSWRARSRTSHRAAPSRTPPWDGWGRKRRRGQGRHLPDHRATRARFAEHPSPPRCSEDRRVATGARRCTSRGVQRAS
jgi:two-component system CheB/CheR fusion protein